MAGTTYSNLTTDIRNYTEVDANVFTAAGSTETGGGFQCTIGPVNDRA